MRYTRTFLFRCAIGQALVLKYSKKSAVKAYISDFEVKGKAMNKDKIKQIFDIMDDFCQAHNECLWCPFLDDDHECAFKNCTGEIPPTFETLLEE